MDRYVAVAPDLARTVECQSAIWRALSVSRFRGSRLFSCQTLMVSIIHDSRAILDLIRPGKGHVSEHEDHGHGEQHDGDGRHGLVPRPRPHWPAKVFPASLWRTGFDKSSSKIGLELERDHCRHAPDMDRLEKGYPQQDHLSRSQHGHLKKLK